MRTLATTQVIFLGKSDALLVVELEDLGACIFLLLLHSFQVLCNKLRNHAREILDFANFHDRCHKILIDRQEGCWIDYLGELSDESVR